MPSSSRTRNSRQATTTKRKVVEEDSESSEASGEIQNKKRKQYDSDALDDESEDDLKPTRARKSPVKSNGKAKQTPKTTPRKKKKTAEEEYEDSEDDLKEGQEVVGRVVQAPTTGRVPPGQISKNTLDFLTHLADPACNDREWFRLHEPIYRVAEKEFKDFVEAFTDNLVEVDPQIPHLPPKDVIHRIYRDIRFSNDKTPYKRGFSASFSRSGRKGIFAVYHVLVKPGNQSLIAGGLWAPGRAELANVRTNLLRNSTRFKRVISSPEFVKFFGAAKPHPKGEPQNIFGREDQLKVAPKGVPKDHKDIDILKCRSFAVLHLFSDSEVLEPNFREKLADVARVLQPFVHILNELLTVGGGSAVAASDEEEDEDDGNEESGDEGDEDGDEE